MKKLIPFIAAGFQREAVRRSIVTAVALFGAGVPAMAVPTGLAPTDTEKLLGSASVSGDGAFGNGTGNQYTIQLDSYAYQDPTAAPSTDTVDFYYRLTLTAGATATNLVSVTIPGWSSSESISLYTLTYSDADILTPATAGISPSAATFDATTGKVQFDFTTLTGQSSVSNWFEIVAAPVTPDTVSTTESLIKSSANSSITLSAEGGQFVSTTIGDLPSQAIPEPSGALFGAALVGMTLTGRRVRRALPQRIS